LSAKKQLQYQAYLEYLWNIEEAEKVANLDRFEGQYVKDGIIKGYSDNTN